jgi:hypothetical protein
MHEPVWHEYPRMTGLRYKHSPRRLLQQDHLLVPLDLVSPSALLRRPIRPSVIQVDDGVVLFLVVARYRLDLNPSATTMSEIS